MKMHNDKTIEIASILHYTMSLTDDSIENEFIYEKRTNIINILHNMIDNIGIECLEYIPNSNIKNTFLNIINNEQIISKYQFIKDQVFESQILINGFEIYCKRISILDKKFIDGSEPNLDLAINYYEKIVLPLETYDKGYITLYFDSDMNIIYFDSRHMGHMIYFPFIGQFIYKYKDASLSEIYFIYGNNNISKVFIKLNDNNYDMFNNITRINDIEVNINPFKRDTGYKLEYYISTILPPIPVCVYQFFIKNRNNLVYDIHSSLYFPNINF